MKNAPLTDTLDSDRPKEKTMKQRSAVDLPVLFLSLVLGVLLFCFLSVDLSQIPEDADLRRSFPVLRETNDVLRNPFAPPAPDRTAGEGSFPTWLRTYGAPGNLFSLGLAAGLYPVLLRWKRRRRGVPTAVLITGVLFGALNAAGLYLFFRKRLPAFRTGPLLLFMTVALAHAFVFCVLADAGAWIIRKYALKRSAAPGGRCLRLFADHVFLCSFALILLGWLPWIVSYYPASMEWDVYEPILRYLGEWKKLDHHPWFYSCVIGWFYSLGIKLGDKNVGVFLYTVLRAIAMAAMYARCASLLKRSRMPDAVCLLCALFFAVTPVWGAYAKHAFKDSIAAAAFCWYVSLAVRVVLSRREDGLSPAVCLEYSAAALTGMLFRHNVVYCVAPVTLLLIAAGLRRRERLSLSALLSLGVVCLLSYNGYIHNVSGIRKGSVAEMLSIPIQQTARTVRDHGDTITDAEKSAIGGVLRYDSIAESYNPVISDPVKNNWHGKTAQKREYMLTWAEMAFKYPLSYMEAFIAHTSGYYAFTPEYTEDKYNVGMSIFDWVEDTRFSESVTCSYAPGTDAVRLALDNWAKLWHQIPVLNLTDMKPLYTWMILLLALYFLRRRESDMLPPVLACVLMILTCVASPVNDCFRYYAPVAAAFPALSALLRREPRSEYGIHKVS